jgi:hypothetical protein
MDRSSIMHALHAFIESRPGFDPADYIGARDAYRADARRALRDLHDARAMLRAIHWRDSITADDIIRAKHHRITFTPSCNAVRVDYCTGQYYPTEYRAAACATLASTFWGYFRDKCGAATREDIQRMARADLGRSIARRWFA